jgi:hypothetical protein
MKMVLSNSLMPLDVGSVGVPYLPSERHYLRITASPSTFFLSPLILVLDCYVLDLKKHLAVQYRYVSFYRYPMGTVLGDLGVQSRKGAVKRGIA